MEETLLIDFTETEEDAQSRTDGASTTYGTATAEDDRKLSRQNGGTTGTGEQGVLALVASVLLSIAHVFVGIGTALTQAVLGVYRALVAIATWPVRTRSTSPLMTLLAIAVAAFGLYYGFSTGIL